LDWVVLKTAVVESAEIEGRVRHKNAEMYVVLSPDGQTMAGAMVRASGVAGDWVVECEVEIFDVEGQTERGILLERREKPFDLHGRFNRGYLM
jgi:hypothetical protein